MEIIGGHAEIAPFDSRICCQSLIASWGIEGFAGSSPQSPASKLCRLPDPTLSFSVLQPVVWLFFRRLEFSAIRENVSGRWIGSALTKLTYPAPCSE